jgi:hypothetical protein
MGELKHGKNMRCKHTFRPISAVRNTRFGPVNVALNFHKFFNFCQTNFVYKVHLRRRGSAHVGTYLQNSTLSDITIFNCIQKSYQLQTICFLNFFKIQIIKGVMVFFVFSLSASFVLRILMKKSIIN